MTDEDWTPDGSIRIMKTRPGGYVATPKLLRDLARSGRVLLEGGRYRATVASAGPDYFEAWTDTAPFVYGRPSRTLQGALDSLEELVRDTESGKEEAAT